MSIPKPTAKLPVVELYMVDAKNPRLFVTGYGGRTTKRALCPQLDLDAPDHLICPKGITWRYVRLKKPTV